jgi:hypothetical protein
MTDPLRIDEVVDCTLDLMRHLARRPDDAAVKLAALKSAAALVENAIGVAAMTQAMKNILDGSAK